jgi:hypothetical protein
VPGKSDNSRSGAPPGDASSAETGSGSDRSGPRAQPSEDIALVCGVSEDGQGVEVIRKRGERIETGTVRRLEPGKPIHGEVVRLRPRARAPFVCDVEVEFAGPAREEETRRTTESLGANSGPAQVATESYRKNWDAVYGRTRKPSLLN